MLGRTRAEKKQPPTTETSNEAKPKQTSPKFTTPFPPTLCLLLLLSTRFAGRARAVAISDAAVIAGAAEEKINVKKPERGRQKKKKGSAILKHVNSFLEKTDHTVVLKVQVDVEKARARGEAGDGRHRAEQRVEEAGTDTGADVAHGDDKVCWDAFELGVGRDRVLRLGHADGQVGESLIQKVVFNLFF